MKMWKRGYAEGFLWEAAKISMFLIMILISLSLSPGTGVANAQDEGATQRATRLDLGFAQSPPGSNVMLPMTLIPTRGVVLGSTTNEITFPTQLLSFVEAKKGLAVEVAEAEITTEVRQDDQDPENSILTVTISGKGTAIPRGVLVDLVFILSEQAQLGETILLGNVASAMSPDDPPRLIETVTGTEGRIVVDETPVIFSCFFYMH